MISLHASQRRTRKARIEMVPLIDCMFLLLTFFIYVAATMAAQHGIPVNLATASTGETAGKEEAATISIDQAGQWYLNKRPITEEQLRGELKRLASLALPKPVVIQADKEVVHSQVVEVLDLARQCGVPQVVFAVQAGSTKRSSPRSRER